MSKTRFLAQTTTFLAFVFLAVFPSTAVNSAITRPDDSQVRTEAYEQIKEELSTYFAEIKSLDNSARYRHGKIVFEVAIEVAGIAFTGGGANLATNAKRASKAMVEITDKATDFIRVFRTKTGRHIDDLASLEKAFEGFKNINNAHRGTKGASWKGLAR